MRILYINHYAGSYFHGMEFRPYLLAREWVRLGYKVDIVAASYSHLRQKQPLVKGLKSSEIVDGISYSWLRTPSYRANNFRRSINVFVFIIGLIFRTIEFVKKKPTVVIASSTYPLDILPAKLIAFLSGAKLIHEVHDLWPLTLTEIGGASKWNPFVLLLQWAENYSYRTADRVVSMLETSFPYMQKHGLTEDRFVFVPNGIVLEDWDNECPLDPELIKLIDSIRDKKHLLVGYAGGMGVSNSISCLIQAFKSLQGEPVSLILVGDGEDRRRLEKIVRENGMTNVHFFDVLPKKEIPAFLKRVDITFIGAPKSPLYQFGVSPNKLLDYMMAAKPVLYAIESGNNWVRDSQCGYSLVSENSQAIVKAIEDFLRLPVSERQSMGKKGQEFVRVNFLYSTLAKKFLAGV